MAKSPKQILEQALHIIHETDSEQVIRELNLLSEQERNECFKEIESVLRVLREMVGQSEKFEH